MGLCERALKVKLAFGSNLRNKSQTGAFLGSREEEEEEEVFW